MVLIKRLLPILTSALIFAGLEFILWKPRFIYLVILFLIVILCVITWQIIGRGLTTLEARWFYLLTPIAFLIGGALFLLFLENPWWQHTLIFILSIFIGIFLENIFIYIYQHEKYQTNSLENISNYLNLTSVFLLNSSLFGFSIFLNIPLWQLSLISLVTSFILTFQTIWVNKIKPETAWLHILVICLILFELFWTISFLPIAFYTSGLILATSFYLMNNLMRLHLLSALNKKVIKRYFVLCGFVIILVLITAKWY